MPNPIINRRLLASGNARNGFLNGLVSYWAIDGALGLSGIQADSQDGNVTTLSGGTINASGGLFAGTGYLGSSGNARLNLTPAPANLRLGTGASFTFQIWVAGSGFTTGTWGGQYDGTQAGSAWVLFANGGSARAIGYSTDSTQNAIGPLSALTTGTAWNHIIWGYDASAKLLFLQLNGGTRTTQATTADLNSVATAFQMDADATGDNFVGNINQAAFWNRPLSPSNAVALYNSGYGLPLSSFTT